MSLTIWKYPLFMTNLQVIDLPLGAKLLAVQLQNDQPTLWALVDSSADSGKRRIRIYGTGHAIDADERSLRYVDTFQLHGGALVFHVFEEAP